MAKFITTLLLALMLSCASTPAEQPFWYGGWSYHPAKEEAPPYAFITGESLVDVGVYSYAAPMLSVVCTLSGTQLGVHPMSSPLPRELLGGFTSYGNSDGNPDGSIFLSLKGSWHRGYLRFNTFVSEAEMLDAVRVLTYAQPGFVGLQEESKALRTPRGYVSMRFDTRGLTAAYDWVRQRCPYSY